MTLRHRLVLLLAATGLALAAGAAPSAAAPDTVISFDGFADHTQTLLDQYEPQGVYFLPDASTAGAFPSNRFEFCNSPPRLTPDQGFNDAALVPSCGNEFDNEGVLGVFTTFRSRVEMDIGHVANCNSCAVQVDLTAWRIDHTKVATSSVTLPVASGPHTHISVTSGAQDIAFFSIRSDLIADGPRFLFDTLRYDNPDTPPPADFVFGLSGSGGVTARQGATRTFPLTLLRFNGSSGPVGMSVSGLPDGISASSFSPNPATGRATTLSLTASFTSVPGSSTATVTGTPGGPGAGASPRHVDFTVRVVPPFTLTAPANLEAPVCTPTSVTFPEFGISAETDFTEPIDVKTRSTPSGPGIPPLEATVTPSTYNPGFRDSSPSLTVTVPVGGDETTDLIVRAESGYPASERGVSVKRVPGDIGTTQVFGGSADTAFAPAQLREGDRVVLFGRGFCAGTTQVQFGNDKARVNPEELNVTPSYYSGVPGGPWQRISVRVPRLATSGTVDVVNPAGQITGRRLTIHSYRNTDGFSFRNYGKASGKGWSPSFTDVQELFGYDETHVTIDPCSAATLGLANCAAATLPIPDPGAVIFTDGVKDAAAKGDGGHCFGISLATLWFGRGRLNVSDFTPGARTIHDLAGPAGPSPKLAHLIDLLHLAQYSRESALFRKLSNDVDEGAAGLREQIRAQIAAGKPPLIIIHQGEKGHAVVAYDLEDAGGGAYYIYLWDPNDPAVTDTDVPDGEKSRIKITPDNRWDFKGLGWTGDLRSIYAMPWDVIPRAPKLPGSIGEMILLSASADLVQVTDDKGRKLLNASGEEAQGKSAIPGSSRFEVLDSQSTNPSYQVPLGGSYTVELRGHGPYNATFHGKDVGARIETGGAGASAAAAGAKDSIAIDTKRGRLSFKRGAGTAALTETLLAKAKDGSQRSVTAHAGRTAGDTLAFDRARNTVTYRHSGPATTVVFDLGYSARGALPATFTTKPTSVRNGDTVILRPTLWRALGASRLTLTLVRGGHRSSATLANRVRAATRLGIGRLTDVAAPGKGRRLGIPLTIARKPPVGTQAGVVWVISKGRKVVARSVQNLTAAQLQKGKRTFLFDTKLKPGTYRFSAAAFAFTPGRGVTVSTAQARRSQSLRVR